MVGVGSSLAMDWLYSSSVAEMSGPASEVTVAGKPLDDRCQSRMERKMCAKESSETCKTQYSAKQATGG